MIDAICKWTLLIFTVIIIILLFRNYNNLEQFKSIDKPQSHLVNIILMGDYILHEPNTHSHRALKHPSIRSLLQKMYPHSNIKEITTTCATLQDLKSQIGHIPRKWNTNNTIAIMSIGNNDIYQNLINCKKVFDTQPKNAKEPIQTSLKLDCLSMEEIGEKWHEQIQLLQSTFPKIKIILLSSFYPKKNTEIKTCNGEKTIANTSLLDDIDKWNLELSQFSINHNMSFIALDKHFNNTDMADNSLYLNIKAVRKLANILGTEIDILYKNNV